MRRSTKGSDYQDIPRPIAALADEYPPGHHDPHHHHKRAQLIYACAGITVVITEQASFVVPPQRAVWVPAGVEHEAHMRGHVSLRTLYIDSHAFPDLPKTCRVIEVSTLLRELIIEACRIPVEYDVAGRDGRVMDLLMTELLAMPATPLDVPMPQDPRLVKVCTAILRDPGQHEPLEEANVGNVRPGHGEPLARPIDQLEFKVFLAIVFGRHAAFGKRQRHDAQDRAPVRFIEHDLVMRRLQIKRIVGHRRLTKGPEQAENKHPMQAGP